MKEDNKFAQSILSKIKKEKIKPKPRWQFLLKDYIVWSFGVFSLLIGSLSVSVIIYFMNNNDWNIYWKASKSFLEFVLLTLPYFWFIFLSLFIFVIYYNIKHTKKGYRYSLHIVILVSVLLSIFCGGIFYKIGFGQAIDNILGNNDLFYTRVFNRQIYYWSQVDKGRLSGIVISIPSDKEFTLLDLEEQEWYINSTIVENKNCINNHISEIVVGKPVKMIGEKCGEFHFCAKEIMPVRMGRRFFEKRHHNYFDKMEIINQE